MGVICKDTLTAVITTRNRKDELERCIRSIYRDVKDVIIVIDDTTTEDIESFERKYSNVHVFRYTGNMGPCLSINKGIKLADTDYVYVIDSDAEIVRLPESVIVPDDVSIVAPKVLDTKYFKLYSDGDENKQQNIPWFYGCAFIANKPAWETVCGYTPDYFIYYNEPDISRRLLDYGYTILYNPDLAVIHKESDTVNEFQTYYLVRNCIWFAWNHLPFLRMVLTIGKRVLLSLRYPLTTIRAVKDAVMYLPVRNPTKNKFFVRVW